MSESLYTRISKVREVLPETANNLSNIVATSIDLLYEKKFTINLRHSNFGFH
jgi:hypothetical protein